MNIDDMINGMTPEVYQRLVTAVKVAHGHQGSGVSTVSYTHLTLQTNGDV